MAISSIARSSEAFFRPGLDQKNWTSRANYAAQGIVQTGEKELSIYVNHNVGYATTHIRRYTIWPDGFASVHAGFDTGELTTKPLVFSGEQLRINYSTSAAGGMRIEIQDAKGTPIPGYRLAECPEIIGDELERTVFWTKKRSVEELAGKPVRLRVWLRDADLFSLRFGK